MDYIKGQCKPKDGKLLAIGHSMGGILLYATLSRNSMMLSHIFYHCVVFTIFWRVYLIIYLNLPTVCLYSLLVIPSFVQFVLVVVLQC